MFFIVIALALELLLSILLSTLSSGVVSTCEALRPEKNDFKAVKCFLLRKASIEIKQYQNIKIKRFFTRY